MEIDRLKKAVRYKRACRYPLKYCGISSFGRASDFQSEGGRFEPGIPHNLNI